MLYLVFLHVELDDSELENNLSESDSKAKESEIEEVKEVNLLAHDIDIQKEAHQNENNDKFVIPERSFNLIKNLQKINCERYSTILLKEGYGDEVSYLLFSQLYYH